MYSTKIYNTFEELPLDNLANFYSNHKLLPMNEMAKGEHIKLAILDSGVDIMHDYLVDRIHGVFNILRNSELECVDKVGHGTYVAGIICGRGLGVLPNVQTHIVKVTDDYGNMAHETIIDGIKWSINNKMDIICLALSTPLYDAELEKYVRLAHEEGIIIVASAGNTKDEVHYPAKFKEVLAVGSIDFDYNSTIFSPYSEGELDIVLPAIDIPSLYSFGRFATASGSSSATAIATVIVTILQHLRKSKFGTKYNLLQLKQWFQNNSESIEVDNGTKTFRVPTFTNTLDTLIKSDFQFDKVL